MKIILTFILVYSLMNPFFSQDYNKEKMPFVTTNLLDQYPLQYNIEHQMTIGGAWGLGFSAQYAKRKVLYAKASLGYAWGWAVRDKEKDNPLQKSHWKPFSEIAVGYPVFDFTWGMSGKYVLAQSSDDEYTYQDVFRVKIPVTTMFIPLVNYRLNPYTEQFSRSTGIQTSLPATMKQTVTLNTIGFGLKILTMGCANFRGNSDGDDSEYTARRMGSLYIGVTSPISKKSITPGEPYSPISANAKPSLDLMIEVSGKHNPAATFNFGVRSIGYKGLSQLVFGNTIILN